MGSAAELETMESEDMFQTKKDHRNPLVPLGALATAAILCGGLYSFKRGRSQQSQMFMRARVLMQGATVALMVGTVYAAGKE
ncbi:hypothetical protein R1sor_018453 [Riccia sorocarpa]|uniref:HIG1 domain-containing protein n=1 Tax=Riccia sorocarpa TaxID=122646 RepID=A0ABD3IA72_9MARC